MHTFFGNGKCGVCENIIVLAPFAFHTKCRATVFVKSDNRVGIGVFFAVDPCSIFSASDSFGTLRDDLFERMTANYEKEQKELIQAVAEAEQRLANAEQDNIDLRAFLSIIRKCTDLKELTPELVNRLITKIEVFDSTKDENGKKHVPIKVHFIGVGVLEIPDGKTILETHEEIRKNPPIVA